MPPDRLTDYQKLAIWALLHVNWISTAVFHGVLVGLFTLALSFVVWTYVEDL